MSYRILITRSLLGRFTWDILNHNKQKIGGSAMFTKKENCEKTAKKLAGALNCPVEYIDLNDDFEE